MEDQQFANQVMFFPMSREEPEEDFSKAVIRHSCTDNSKPEGQTQAWEHSPMMTSAIPSR